MQFPLHMIFSLAIIALVNGQGQWSIQQPNLAQILVGVSFPTPTTGFVSGDANGTGPIILRTDDGGNTYTSCSLDGLPLFFTDIALATTTSGVVTGIGEAQTFHSIEYTTDGRQWNETNPSVIEESQCVEVIRGLTGGYATTGQFQWINGTYVNGVSVTYDGGVTWKNINIASTQGYARYGSFPSPKTWYVTSGLWPESDFTSPKNQGYFSLTSNIRLHKNKNAEFSFQYMNELQQKIAADDNSDSMRKRLFKSQNQGYLAEVSKSIDGGLTWTTVFHDETTYYLNGISCPTETDCWAVGESQLGSIDPGARILHTKDGGQTWTEQLRNNENGYSLVDIFFVSTTEGWAVGGVLNVNFQGQYWHTVDAGQTWTAQTVNGVYGLGLSFVWSSTNTYHGWSTALNLRGGSSVLTYKSSP